MSTGPGGFLLDLKLALRMLTKYPLLTIVGGAGMAFGLAAGISGFEIRTQMTNPALPLADGSRIVGLRNWDVRRDRPAPLREADFTAWREQLHTVEDLGAAALVERNLDVDGDVGPVDVAQISASGFRVARVLPLVGRTFVESDEGPGATPVSVIGYSLWQRRFGADPNVIGRLVRLGSEQTTIVGVMPDGFGFPVAHQLWVPLPRSPVNAADSASLLVFGRLARGVTADEARAELATVGRRMASGAANAGDELRPEVVPYAHLIFDPREYVIVLALANVFLIMLIVVVSANVALLMFARAASREIEISVRSALGASRARIVLQLFVEAVALASLSVIAGIVAARYGVRSLWRMYEADAGHAVPFWFNDRLTSSTLAYAVALMMVGAAIIGVFPALKVTGRGLQSRLRHFSTGGGGYRFGGVWTAVIVAQVAVTVVFPAAAFFFHRWVVQGQTRDIGFAAEQYLSARVVADVSNVEATIEELRMRLAAEPDVTAVTIADALPGTQHPHARFDVDGGNAPAANGHLAGVASIDAGFFGALRAPLLSGRGFTPSDVSSGREVAIVNASFVERVMHEQTRLAVESAARRLIAIDRLGRGLTSSESCGTLASAAPTVSASMCRFGRLRRPCMWPFV